MWHIDDFDINESCLIQKGAFLGGYHTSQAPFIVSASTVADCLRYSLFTCCNLHTNEDCKTNENARVSVSAGRLFAVLFIHLWQFTTNENAGIVKKNTNASVNVITGSLLAVGNLHSPVTIYKKIKNAGILKKWKCMCVNMYERWLGSRPQKMYGERLGDGAEYHLMSPTPRR